MGDTNRSGTVTPTKCATCGAERELVRSGTRTAARCETCGGVEDVEIVCAPRAKWTLVGPDGTVRSFASRAELLAADDDAAPPTPAPAEAAVPASTPTAAPSPTATPSPTAAPSPTLSVAPPVTISAAPPPKPTGPPPKSSAAPPKVSAKPPALPRSATVPPIASSSSILSDDSVPSVVPTKTGAPTKQESDSDEAILSVRDLTVVPLPALPSRAPPATSAPPPPLPKNRLKTLAPPSRHDAPPPPPPSIDVGTDAQAVAASSIAPAPNTKESAKPKSVSRAPGSDADAPRGWLLPAAAIALVAGVIWFAVRSTPNTSTGDPRAHVDAAAPVATFSPANVVPSTSTAPSASAVPSVLSSADAAPSASAASAASARGTTPPDKLDKPDAAAKPVSSNSAAADAVLPLAELLTRASAARRTGDNARARALLDRALVVSPGNVEAYTGLGDLARTGGDLGGAKAAYTRALATSPSYSSALLGLADTEWDLGDKAAAQGRYQTLVQNASSPPERAKVRAAGTTAPAPPTTATASIKTLTSADLPPPVAPKPNP